MVEGQGCLRQADRQGGGTGQLLLPHCGAELGRQSSRPLSPTHPPGRCLHYRATTSAWSGPCTKTAPSASSSSSSQWTQPPCCAAGTPSTPSVCGCVRCDRAGGGASTGAGWGLLGKPDLACPACPCSHTHPPSKLAYFNPSLPKPYPNTPTGAGGQPQRRVPHLPHLQKGTGRLLCALARAGPPGGRWRRLGSGGRVRECGCWRNPAAAAAGWLLRRADALLPASITPGGAAAGTARVPRLARRHPVQRLLVSGPTACQAWA